MITNKELSEVKLSPTKKDYYQIWNELMELAEKISERWSPASTNESDPGIVLLKALTAVADKLNYNIDKNTLEAFMPSATQEDSMRKLTEMMGYDMKHYRSATGKVTIAYKNSNDTSIKNFGDGIYFPKFINLKNEDEDINYITLEDFTLQDGQDSREVAIIEGELLECETNNDNIITLLHLDDSNRYILPEYTIAENGIFITNIADSKESDLWRREQNLNVQQAGSKVYKVGVDSALQLPYIQFPEDIKVLIEDGLRIKYVRTNGLNGNIAAKVLSKFEKPSLWSTADSELIKNLSVDSFAITNPGATTNGVDPESLTSAYNNYKKTIGTFDTLVTCRDYMNKIYQMTESDTDTTPLTSNIIVSDIRDDINRSTPVCTFNEYGICYKDASLTGTEVISLPLRDGSGEVEVRQTKAKIDYFDLVFYPFKAVYGLNTKTEYKNSFKYTAENLQKVKAGLALSKTMAHSIKEPDDSDIACIKNYLKLKARVTTTKKVTFIEEAEILNNIYKAIYANFNARQIDLGEEIPYENIVDVLKNADYRIKEISLDEPMLNTKLSLVNGDEELLSDATNMSERGKKLYNTLVRRNIFAGRVSAFQYDANFISEYDKTSYPGYPTNYPDNSGSLSENEEKIITKIISEFDVGTAFAARSTANGLELKENEVIQFRAPNFKTTKTYPAYVNYFIKLNSATGSEDAIPATFKSLGTYMEDTNSWSLFVNQPNVVDRLIEDSAITTTKSTEEGEVEKQSKFKAEKDKHVVLFKKDGTNYIVANGYESDTSYYYLPINDNLFAVFNSWIRQQDGNHLKEDKITKRKLEGIYRTVGVQEKPFGKYIDIDLKKYLPAYKFGSVATNKEVLNNFFVQETRSEDDTTGTADGLGKDATYIGVPKGGEYQLKEGEYLLINYTDSKTDETGVETKTVINKTYYKGCADGDIIRANFELIDSALYHNNHSYSKRDGFTFSGQQPEGMFTLGTNEQIEIRNIVQVDLDEDTMYLYWTLNSDDPEKESNVFEFTESYSRDNTTYPAYTLKEGEHLYYTNSKKQDLVYYGAGTLIVKNNPNLVLKKEASDGEVSEEDIMTKGLAAAIPWQAYSLGNGKGLKIIENQYISLTDGDTIISIDKLSPVTSAAMPGGSWNNWTEIRSSEGGAEYKFAEDETKALLPTIAVEGIKWSVRSRLDFNMSKSTAQALNVGDSLTVVCKDKKDQLSQKYFSTAQVNKPIYINSNYTCQAATDTIQLTETAQLNTELMLKVSSLNTPQVSGGGDLRLNNYINGDAKYTKFNFANLSSSLTTEKLSEADWKKLDGNADKTTEDYTAWLSEIEENRKVFKLNINIPSSAFGLALVYYIPGDEEVEDEPGYRKGAYLKAKDEDSDVIGLTLFNKEFKIEDEKEVEAYYFKKDLQPGLNIIKVTHEVKQLEVYTDSRKKSTIIFGSLDLVTGINSKLDYKTVDTAAGNTPLKQLLTDIRASGVADDFYYNIPIQRANEIDINTYIEDEKLSSPLIWYDPNNVNRKFVISEIDADYLSTGITLTKASRV